MLLLVARILNNTFRTYDQIYRCPGQNGGLLGSAYDPLIITRDPSDPQFRVTEIDLRVTANQLQDRRQLLSELAQNLARIHALPTERVLPMLGPLPADRSPMQFLLACRSYLSGHEDQHPVLEWCINWLDINQPEAYEQCVVHRDYRTGNYVVSGGRLVAVLDWEFDLNWQYLYIPEWQDNYTSNTCCFQLEI